MKEISTKGIVIIELFILILIHTVSSKCHSLMVYNFSHLLFIEVVYDLLKFSFTSCDNTPGAARAHSETTTTTTTTTMHISQETCLQDDLLCTVNFCSHQEGPLLIPCCSTSHIHIRLAYDVTFWGIYSFGKNGKKWLRFKKPLRQSLTK